MDEARKEQRTETLAREALDLSRDILLVRLRFLDGALSRFRLVSAAEVPFGTDGHAIVYDPKYVLGVYADDQAVLTRDLLHLALHCVFRHLYFHAFIHRQAWDLACDVAVEQIITQLGEPELSSPREAAQRPILESLGQAVGELTAGRVYQYCLEQGLSEEELERMREPFRADDHRLWYHWDDGDGVLKRLHVKLSEEEDEDQKRERESHRSPFKSLSMGEADWQGVAERMQLELETFSGRRRGARAGALTQNLRDLRRERFDYTELLKQFAIRGEVMHVSADEFDYIFYTYGLQLYENMPLVEPLEYQEVMRIREFVIAIDTSGSTSGELVQAFVQKTYNILLTTESFFSRIELHIIQCDAEIQEHVRITTKAEFERYIKHMKIHGQGGTDFRPVFDLVDKLVAERQLPRLQGLIYFTDGQGTFPQKPPPYRTAFVFLDDDGGGRRTIPPWAMGVSLRKEEINEII